MKFFVLLLFVLVSLSAGVIGGLATSSSVKTWYPEIVKPSWNPPASLFGPVWTLLFILIGVSAWRVWLTGQFWGAPAAIFGVQFVFNLAWSWLFFAQHRPDWAFLDIVVLWLSIVAMLVTFWRIDRPAGWVLVPYLLWVSFASILNFSIWMLNRPVR